MHYLQVDFGEESETFQSLDRSVLEDMARDLFLDRPHLIFSGEEPSLEGETEVMEDEEIDRLCDKSLQTVEIPLEDLTPYLNY